MKLFVMRTHVKQENCAALFHFFHVEAEEADDLAFSHALTD